MFLGVLCIIPIILKLGKLGRRSSASSFEASTGYSIRLCLKMIRQKSTYFVILKEKLLKGIVQKSQ